MLSALLLLLIVSLKKLFYFDNVTAWFLFKNAHYVDDKLSGYC